MTNVREINKVSNFHYRNSDFVIVTGAINDGEIKYFAIDAKFIENGVLKKELNGIQMLMSDSLAECLKRVKEALDYRHFKAMGYSNDQALCLACMGYIPDGLR